MNLSKANFNVIKVLYKLVYGKDDPGHVNQYRRRLKGFCGFNLALDSTEFSEKLADFHAENPANLITLCNFCHLDYSGSQEDLRLLFSQ